MKHYLEKIILNISDCVDKWSKYVYFVTAFFFWEKYNIFHSYKEFCNFDFQRSGRLAVDSGRMVEQWSECMLL